MQRRESSDGTARLGGGAGTQADSLLAIVIKVDLTILLRKGKIGPKIN